MAAAAAAVALAAAAAVRNWMCYAVAAAAVPAVVSGLVLGFVS